MVQFVGEKPLDPLTLVVSLDSSGKAVGTLYEDAGEGYGYQKGEFLLSTYEAVREGGKVTVRLVKSEGSMPRKDRTLRVEVLSEVNGRPVVFKGEGKDGAAITVTATPDMTP